MSRKTGSKTTKEETGTRNEKKPRFDLIPTSPLKRLADRYALGLENYGEFNWYKGLPLSDTLNHITDHLLHYRDFTRVQRKFAEGLTLTPLELNLHENGGKDDDLAAAAWGCFALMWLEENGKLL